MSGNSVYEDQVTTCPKIHEKACIKLECLIDPREILREIDLQCPVGESLV
jgi:hypothetical protein